MERGWVEREMGWVEREMGWVERGMGGGSESIRVTTTHWAHSLDLFFVQSLLETSCISLLLQLSRQVYNFILQLEGREGMEQE